MPASWFHVVGSLEEPGGVGLDAMCGQCVSVGGVAFLDVELGQAACKSYALMAMLQEVLHGRRHATSVVCYHSWAGQTGLLVAEGHQRLARVTQGLEVIARHGLADRNEPGHALPGNSVQPFWGAPPLVVYDGAGGLYRDDTTSGGGGDVLDGRYQGAVEVAGEVGRKHADRWSY